MPVTSAPRVAARWRVVPPTPQPTSRMRSFFVGGTGVAAIGLPAAVVVVAMLSGLLRLEMSRSRRIRLI